MLQIRNLTKSYSTVRAVDDLTLDVHRGEIFGLLGPNGAGKTTTIRTILNILLPDIGAILFDGAPFTKQTWMKIGYLPEERGLYRKSSILETIIYFASLKGMTHAMARTEAERWLNRFDIVERASNKVEQLSKGNQQKIQFIISVLHKPSLLVLDEPFSGFDPVNQVLLKDILLELKEEGTAIVFSTHQMDQVEKLCQRICLINEGRSVLQGPLREIKQEFGKNAVHLHFDGEMERLRLLNGVTIVNVFPHFAELEITVNTNIKQLLQDIAASVDVKKFEIVEPSLESIFLDVVRTPKVQQQ